MNIPVNKQNFLSGDAYLAYADSVERKVMARFVPQPSVFSKFLVPAENLTLCVTQGELTLYDFETLTPLYSCPLSILGAARFYDAHCAHDAGAVPS